MDFATKRQVWLRMILRIIRPMLIAMRIGQKSTALLLSSFVYTKLLGATLFSVAPSDRHYRFPFRKYRLPLVSSAQLYCSMYWPRNRFTAAMSPESIR